MARAAGVGDRQREPRQFRGPRISAGGGEFDFGQTALVETERRPFAQRTADHRLNAVEPPEVDADQDGACRRPNGEQIEVLRGVEGVLECRECALGVAEGLAGDADRAPRGRSPASVPDSGGDVESFGSCREGLVAAAKCGECLRGVPQRVALAFGVSDGAGEVEAAVVFVSP